MQKLPELLAEEIAALESLDARALRRKYPALLRDLPECAVSAVLRATVAYRLQEKHYGLHLPEAAREWLAAENGGGSRVIDRDKTPGARSRIVRVWRGTRYEAIVRDDGRYEYDGQIYGSLSAVAKAITGTHWNGKLFFGLK